MTDKNSFFPNIKNQNSTKFTYQYFQNKFKILRKISLLFVFLGISFTQVNAQSLAQQLSSKAENYFNHDVPNLLYNEGRKHMGREAGGDLFLRLKLYKNGNASVKSQERDDQVSFTSIVPLRTADGRFTYEKKINIGIYKDTFKDHKYFDAVWNVVVTTVVNWDVNDNAISKSTARIDWQQKPCVKMDFEIASLTHCFEEEASEEMLKNLKPMLEKLDREIEKSF